MRIVLFLSVYVLASLSSFSQKNPVISGKVIGLSNKPLSSVTVGLLKAKDSSLVKATISDESGAYDFSLSNADYYILKFTAIGYQDYFSESINFLNAVDIKIEDTKLISSKVTLSAVTVSNKKPLVEVKADKLVFNVESSINATGSDAFELLRKSPGLQVDNNDNISMKGKTGVKVYVDGKISQLDAKELAAYLKGISSSDIEAIEMISNPSAKYDASGNAGIVNIRLKKNKKFGTNGSVTAGFVQGITPKGNGAFNINYRNKKINLFGNLGLNLGINQYSMKLNRLQMDTLYDLISVNKNNKTNGNIKAGLDYFVNAKSTFGFLLTSNLSKSDELSFGNTPIQYNPTKTFIKSLQSNSTGNGNTNNSNVNLNYRYIDTSGTEINADADYGLFRKTGENYQPNNYYFNDQSLDYSIVNRTVMPLNIDIYTAKIDVEQKIKKGKLSYGGKVSFVNTDNTFDFFTENANAIPIKVVDKSNFFNYKENVNALYASYFKTLNQKWSVQFGMRMEQTNSEGVLIRADGIIQSDNTVKKSYTDFFPSAALTFNINPKHSLNLTYSRRIDRPTYQDLNPFEKKLDELTYQKGNAFLRPQYTQTVELIHTFMGFINTTLGYSYVSDFSTEMTDTIRNASYVQQRNLATQQMYNLAIGSPTPIKKWWNGYINLWYNYQLFDGLIGVNKVNKKIPLYGAYLQQTFSLGKDYTAELSGWYNGPSIWGATWLTDPQGSLDFGIQKLLFKKEASLKISWTDIFFTAPWHANNNFGGVNVDGGGEWESRTLRVSFNWRFGSKQIMGSRNRKTGIETETKRIK